ncbi:Uncharacterised protein [Bordetella bronchiseptica]|nr:Uncharacterised protein [Bordetella bronchiseptica]
MPRKSTPPPNPAHVLELDISSWHDGKLISSVDGEVRCYLGYRSERQPFDLPWYSPSVALRDKDGRDSHRFVELRSGLLRTSSLPRAEQPQKLLTDRWLILPHGTDSSFGVIDRQTGHLDEELTRRLFGGTRDDIESVAKALARVVGRGFHEMAQLPRVTFSKTRNNSCDLTSCLIPKNFPYLAFDQSQYAWSHVSLFGFYRLLGFLCPSRSAVREAMERSELAAGAIDMLVEAGSQYGKPLSYPSYE